MLRLLITMALLMGTVSGNALAQDTGMACFVKGKPEVLQSLKAWEPLRLFRRLHVGDKIRCDAGSEAIVVLFGRGERFRVAPGQMAEVARTDINGAVSLGGLKGPSEHAARLLAGSSVGASGSRSARRAVELTRPSNAYPGWLLNGNRRLNWNRVEGAADYVFALYNRNDVLLWSTRTKELGAVIPDDIQLSPRTPYIWRLNAFLADGVPTKLGEYRWGVLTLLKAQDASDLQNLEREIKPQIEAGRTDALPRLLLAERYRELGVLTRAWEVIDAAWEDQAINDSERAQAMLEILSEINDAVRLSGQLHVAAESVP